MKSSTDKMKEQGRIIARAMRDVKVENKKAHDNAVLRREKMLHDAAEKELLK